MAIKCTICVILMMKLFLTEFCGKNEKGTKSSTAAIHSRFLQEETMSKTSRYSTVQCRSEPSHQRGQVGQQISSPESGNRSESASEDYQQPSTVSAEDRQAHTRALICVLGPLNSILTQVGPPVIGPGLPPITAPVHTRTQCTNSLCHNPPRLVLVPLLCHPIKKIAPAQLHTVYSFRETLKLNN